jgi:SAM-dependent methyltransferase
MDYVGNELGMFASAANFHGYYRSLLADCLRGRVLEVGAGMGTFSNELLKSPELTLTACEPDRRMASTLATAMIGRAQVVAGGIHDVPDGAGPFDAVVYIDVMEHIEDDRAEVAAAAVRLASGGVLAIGGPAHRWLYSPFDATIGHYRRYDRRSVEALIASCDGLELERFQYFDSVGMILSLGNKWLSRQTLPTRRQVKFWNDVVLPLSRRLDRILGYRVGKSFVAIARRKQTR